MVNGVDVGIEQHVSRLIENIFNNFPDFNWALLERLKNEIYGRSEGDSPPQTTT